MIQSYAVSQREVFQKMFHAKFFFSAHSFEAFSYPNLNYSHLCFQTLNFSPPSSHPRVFYTPLKIQHYLKPNWKQKQIKTKSKQLRWSKNLSINWLTAVFQMWCDGHVWPLHQKYSKLRLKSGSNPADCVSRSAVVRSSGNNLSWKQS